MRWKQHEEPKKFSHSMKIIGGLSYSPQWWTGNVTVTLVTGTIYAIPFLIMNEIRATTISLEVTTARTNGLFRLGIYYNDINMPASLLIDAGEASGASTGVKRLAFTNTLKPDWYWLACTANGNIVTRGTGGGVSFLGFQTNLALDLTGHTGIEVSQTYGAFSDPFPPGAVLNTSGEPPRVMITF